MSDGFDFDKFLAAGERAFNNNVLPQGKQKQPDLFVCKQGDSQNPNITHMTEGYDPKVSHHNFSDGKNISGE